MRLGRLASVHIGIDFTRTGSMRVVGVSRGAVVFETDSPAKSDDLLESLEEGRMCTAAPFFSESILMELTPPPLPAKKVERILPSLLDIQLPFPASECMYVFSKGHATYKAHAMRTADLKAFLAKLAEAKCNPARVVPPAAAVWARALAEIPPSSENEVRALFICEEDYTLLITGKGPEPGAQSVYKTGSEEHARRLRLALGTIPEDMVCICAGSRGESAKTSLLQLDTVNSKNIRVPDSPAFFMARALAFDSMVNSGKRGDLNLRTGALMHDAGRRSEAAPLIRLCAVMAVCAIFITSYSAFTFSRSSSRADSSGENLRSEINAVAGYDVKPRGSAGVQVALEAAGQNVDPAVEVYAANSIKEALSEIALLAQQHSITLHHISLTHEGLTASASTARSSSIDEFISAVKSSGIRAECTEAPAEKKDGSFGFFVHPAKL
jgi:hypothetical protein